MQRHDRGLSESVEWAVFTPLVLLLVLGILQLGLWGYGRVVVVNAAGAAAEAAAPLSASAADGEQVAARIAERAGLSDVSITVHASETEVVAAVAGRMPGALDVGITRVQAQVTRAKERVTRP